MLSANPRANYLAHKEEIDAAMRRVMDSGQYILGPEVEAFEREFAEYIGVAHAVGVGSGTDALRLALIILAVGAGDEVITVPHTAAATVASIVSVGARPVFVDICPDSFTMDPSKLEAVVTDRTCAIIPVHLYGHPADMQTIEQCAEKMPVPVIEDCAQAAGAALDCCRLGTWSHLGAFSFYPTKNIGAIGDGGVVVCGSESDAIVLRDLCQCSRLDELQAAILRVKLKYLDEENARRREIAAIYDERLSGIVRTPQVAKGVTHVYHQYVIRTKKRDELKAALKKQDITTLIHYPVPVHLQPAYADGSHLPETEAACQEILSLPMYPELTDEEVNRVCEAIQEIL